MASTEQRLARLKRKIEVEPVPDWKKHAQALEDRIVAIAEGQRFAPHNNSKNVERDAWILQLLEARYRSWIEAQQKPPDPEQIEVVCQYDRGRVALERIFQQWWDLEKEAERKRAKILP